MRKCAPWATVGLGLVAVGISFSRPDVPNTGAATLPRTGHPDPYDDLTSIPVVSEPDPGPQAVPGNVDILTAHEDDLDPGQNDAGTDDLRSPPRALPALAPVGLDSIVAGEATRAAGSMNQK